MSQYLIKLMKYCAYQERCHSEVRNKLFELGARWEEIDEVIARLIQEGFLNEERFAMLYCISKFNQKSWGKVKIEKELKTKRVSAYCIRKGLEEIKPDIYYHQMCLLIEKKAATLKETNIFIKKQKIARYLLGKGYESEFVWDELRKNNKV